MEDNTRLLGYPGRSGFMRFGTFESSTSGSSSGLDNTSRAQLSKRQNFEGGLLLEDFFAELLLASIPLKPGGPLLKDRTLLLKV